MKTARSSRPAFVWRHRGLVVAAVVAALAARAGSAPAAPTSGESARETTPRWKFSASVVARATYDTNVHLQDLTPDAAIARAVPPRRPSLVSTVASSFALEHRPRPDLLLGASYVPETVVYHSAAAESHRAHRVTLNVNGRTADASWSLANSGTWIDGSQESPTFGCIGGITAMGGIPLRERREAFVGRHSLRLQRSFGKWFLRPGATAYVHDFLTRQSRAAGYENYLDRQEWTVGTDLGRRIAAQASLVAGWRLGRQDQLRLHGVDSPYDSRLQRFLVGLEGTLAPWLTCTILAGPETRHFVSRTPAGFDRDHVYWWTDATVTLRAGPRDHVTVLARRFALPAFASQSLYEDMTYDVNWRRRHGDRLVSQAGFKAYGGFWRAPAARKDWILTPSLQLQYTVNRRCSLELSALFDRAFSRLPNTRGRDYRRQLVSAAVTYAR